MIPKRVKDMKSVLNISSNDNKYFLYSLVAGIMKVEGSLPKKTCSRYSNYVSRASTILMNGIELPVRIKDISKIEEMNAMSISVFQWCLEEECAIPLKHGSGNGVHVDCRSTVHTGRFHRPFSSHQGLQYIYEISY